jgi:hypothetical protein
MWPFKSKKYEIRFIHETKKYVIYNSRGEAWEDSGERGGYFWITNKTYATRFDTIEDAKKAWENSHRPLYTVVERF